MPKKKTILLTAGGTGGHFFPALALAEEFNTHKDLDVRLVTDERCRKYLTDEVKVKSHIIDLYLGSGSRIKSGTSFLSAIIKALLFVIKTKPSVIIGFGGYPSFPLMFVGQLLGIPTIIYEQNSFLGKSNKFFAKKAKIIALAYEITKNLPMDLLAGPVDDFGGGNPKTIFVGDFVRENIKELSSSRGATKSRRGDLVTQGRANYSEIATPLTGARNDDGDASGTLQDGLAGNIFNLLIIGGSQGASIFSELIPNAVSILLSKHPKIKLNITQQVASSHQERVRKIYDELGVKNNIADFFHDIHKYYESCNLVIARSGATTIAELTQIGQPAIFIPYLHAADDHQYYNAKSLEDAGASWCYRQEEITPEILASKLYELISAPKLIQTASANLLKRKTNGTKNLVDTVLKIIT